MGLHYSPGLLQVENYNLYLEGYEVRMDSESFGQRLEYSLKMFGYQNDNLTANFELWASDVSVLNKMRGNIGHPAVLDQWEKLQEIIALCDKEDK